jgi:hypothetical protein
VTISTMPSPPLKFMNPLAVAPTVGATLPAVDEWPAQPLEPSPVPTKLPSAARSRMEPADVGFPGAGAAFSDPR